MEGFERDLKEAEIYLGTAEHLMEKDLEVWNPVVVNCIMAMIKSIDAAYMKYRGYRPKSGGRGHESASRKLVELYEDGTIDELRNS
ncbi:MAG: hypothetical protein ABEI07_00810 [Candidatus Nanohaloarchaea archaeon]